jgi:hypothetical protein
MIKEYPHIAMRRPYAAQPWIRSTTRQAPRGVVVNMITTQLFA